LVYPLLCLCGFTDLRYFILPLELLLLLLQSPLDTLTVLLRGPLVQLISSLLCPTVALPLELLLLPLPLPLDTLTVLLQ
jgi:hypothetical protein